MTATWKYEIGQRLQHVASEVSWGGQALHYVLGQVRTSGGPQYWCRVLDLAGHERARGFFDEDELVPFVEKKEKT